MSWRPSYKITRSFQNVIVAPEWASSLASCVFTPQQWPWFETVTRDTSAPNTMWCLTTSSKLFSTTEKPRSNKMLFVRPCSRIAGNVTLRKSSMRLGFLFMSPRRWTWCGCWRASAAIKRHPFKSSVKGIRDTSRILHPKNASDASRGLTIVCSHLLSQTLNLTLIVILFLIKIQSTKQEEEIVWSETCGRITQCSR